MNNIAELSGVFEVEVSRGAIFITDDDGDMVIISEKQWPAIRDAVDRMIQAKETIDPPRESP